MDLIPSYCARKHGREPVPAVHDIVDHFTAETYGIMVYQEQVMQIVHGLGDIPLRAAYSLIKAISKKKHAVIDAERPKFIEGARQKGLSRSKANDLFDLILKFAGYGFNKSHSTGYAIIAYQTAYLKTFFPGPYMAAVLTFESAARKVEDWVPYLDDCRKTHYPDHSDETPHVGIEVRPPTLNRSDATFSVVYADDEPRDHLHGHIRFGLRAVKGVGGSAIDEIMRERRERGPYASIFDFCDRVDLKAVNRATIEALIKCGAMDDLHGRDARAAMLATLDDAIAAGLQAAQDRRSGQLNMFGVFEEAAPEEAAPVRLAAVAPWDEREALTFEKETLGIHVSGHPLDAHALIIDGFGTPVTQLRSMPHEADVVVGGLLSRVRTHLIRNGRSAGEKMAHLQIEDKTASVECVAFSEAFRQYGTMLEDDAIVFLIGRVDHSRGDVNLVVDRAVRLEDAARQLAGGIEIDLATPVDDDFYTAKLEAIAQAVEHARRRTSGGGRAVEVRVAMRAAGRRVAMRLNGASVVADEALLDRLRELVGPDAVTVRRGTLTPSSPQRGAPYARRRVG
jgi:DNA polymerase-3 subunit alpha